MAEAFESTRRFDILIADALAQDFSGWDFTYLNGRWHEDEPTWSYAQTIRECIPTVASMLDMGTGGGEFLSSLAPLPLQTCATEAYLSNVPIAQVRLEPLGVKVYPVEKHAGLPLEDNTFDLVINRHAAFHSGEVYRILKSGGWFITQQVGGQNNIRLNELLTGVKPNADGSLAMESQKLSDTGLKIIEAQEAFPETRFFDIGAVVFYLKAISWQIPNFSVEHHRDQLIKIHDTIEKDDYLSVSSHRFWIIARKTGV